MSVLPKRFSPFKRSHGVYYILYYKITGNNGNRRRKEHKRKRSEPLRRIRGYSKNILDRSLLENLFLNSFHLRNQTYQEVLFVDMRLSLDHLFRF